jgi:hypothetical protein
MKQLFVAAALLFSASVFAGTIEVANVPTAPILVNDTMPYATAHIQVTNTAATTKNFLGARTLNNLQPGQGSYFCWGWCLGPDTDVTPDPLPLNTNGSSTLDVYFTPASVAGAATITIRIYEQEDLTNFVDVTVEFISVATTSTDPAHLGTTSLLGKAFPVPATDRITATYSLPQGAAGSLSLADLTGREVRAITLATGTTEATLDLSGIAAGTYVLRMTADNRSSGTRIVTVK